MDRWTEALLHVAHQESCLADLRSPSTRTGHPRQICRDTDTSDFSRYASPRTAFSDFQRRCARSRVADLARVAHLVSLQARANSSVRTAMAAPGPSGSHAGPNGASQQLQPHVAHSASQAPAPAHAPQPAATPQPTPQPQPPAASNAAAPVQANAQAGPAGQPQYRPLNVRFVSKSPSSDRR